MACTPFVSTTTRRGYRSCRAPAFSLMELVIVIVVLGVVAAIVIPRVSRGSEGAAVSALYANVEILNKALDLYAIEHLGSYPTATGILEQLTLYSDAGGTKLDEAPDRPQGIIYGPYLREIPIVPVGPNKGSALIAGAGAPGVGWIYVVSERVIRPNLRNGSGALPDDLPIEIANDPAIVGDVDAGGPAVIGGGGGGGGAVGGGGTVTVNGGGAHGGGTTGLEVGE